MQVSCVRKPLAIVGVMIGVFGLLSPASVCAETEYFKWYIETPQYGLLALKPGIDTHESVIAALGKPAETVTVSNSDVMVEIRQRCRSSVYQRQFDNVLRYKGEMEYKFIGTSYELEQTVLVFFDGQGRLCGADVQRSWTLPRAYIGARGLYFDGPNGWNRGRWRETGTAYR